jgi:uncharacterized protein (TIGR02145 family)
MICQFVALQSLGGGYTDYQPTQQKGINIVVAASEGVDVVIDDQVCDLPLQITAAGFMANCQVTAHITTNNANGYTVYLSADDDNTCPSHTDSCLTGLGSASGWFIAPTNQPFDNPATLSNNTWGFAMPKNDATYDTAPTTYFDDTYTVDAVADSPSLTPAQQAFLDAPYASVPTLSNKVKVRDTTTATPSTGDDAHFLLAVRASYGIAAGNYIGSLRLTVDAKIPPDSPPEIHYITPNSQAAVQAWQTVTITGANFMKNSANIVTGVTIGGETCSNLNVINDATLTCQAPAQSAFGNYPVQVTTTIGSSNTVDYEYIDSQMIIQAVNTANCLVVATAFMDIRDGHYYAVQKLADGKCWMLNNLAYGGNIDNNGVEFGTMNHYTSGNGTSGWTSSATSIAYYTDPYADSTANGGGVTQYSGTKCAVSYRTTATSISYTECGFLYNWYAATAGTGTAGMSSGNATASICPVGWRLPTGGGSGDFSALYTALGSNRNNLVGTSSAWRGVYSGNFYPASGLAYQGGDGDYWSSTVYSAAYARALYFGSSVVSPGDSNGNKYNGSAVRCVAN